MTATAFASDPILDRPANPFPSQRPQLRLVERPVERVAAPEPRLAPAAPALSVEVYRRRRFMALLAATVLILALTQLAGISLLDLSPGGAAAAADQATPTVHVVLPGESYEGIASALGAEQPQIVAEQLRTANGGSELSVGQRLIVDLSGLGVTAG